LRHACSAFLHVALDVSTIVVCDHEAPPRQCLEGKWGTVTPVDWPWEGPGFATVYSGCAEALGFGRGCEEQRLEALARLQPGHSDDRVTSLFAFAGERLILEPRWQERIREWRPTGSSATDLPADAPIAAAPTVTNRRLAPRVTCRRGVA